MQPSRENEKAKQTTAKVGAKKTPRSKAQESLREPVTTSPQPPLSAISAAPSMGPVLTQEDYRAACRPESL